MRKLPSQREVTDDLQDAERRRRMQEPYTPHGLENYRSFYSRFTDAENRGDCDFKKGDYTQAAREYRYAVTIGWISRVTGFLSGHFPTEDWIEEIMKKRQTALRKAGKSVSIC